MENSLWSTYNAWVLSLDAWLDKKLLTLQQRCFSLEESSTTNFIGACLTRCAMGEDAQVG